MVFGAVIHGRFRNSSKFHPLFPHFNDAKLPLTPLFAGTIFYLYKRINRKSLIFFSVEFRFDSFIQSTN